MSKQVCCKLHNKKSDGSLMRPGTPTPDKHWAWMLGYKLQMECSGISVGGGEDGPEIHITRDFMNNHPSEFSWIMKFAKSNNLTFTVTENECAKCKGHDDCVRGNQNV